MLFQMVLSAIILPVAADAIKQVAAVFRLVVQIAVGEYVLGNLSEILGGQLRQGFGVFAMIAPVASQCQRESHKIPFGLPIILNIQYGSRCTHTAHNQMRQLTSAST